MDFQELLDLAADTHKKAKRSLSRSEVKFLPSKIAPAQKDVKIKKMSENVRRLLESSETPTTTKSDIKTATSQTRGGFECNDEDDYGYESNSARAFFDKLMTKYEQVPKALPMEDKSDSIKTKVTKLQETKPRSENVGEDKDRKSNKPTDPDNKKSGNEISAKSEDVKKKTSPSSEVVKKKTPAGPKHPPASSFADLIRMAEEAKSKPVEVKPKTDRPMTSREKEKALQARKSAAATMAKATSVKRASARSNSKPVGSKVSPDNGKLKSVEAKLDEQHSKKVEKSSDKAPPKIVGPEFHPAVVKARPMEKSRSNNMDMDRKVFANINQKLDRKCSGSKRPRSRSPSPEYRRKSGDSKNSKKRLRINSESEYDSEMDDFIDDAEATIDISAEIRNIFGYDRNKYRNETDFDDRSMENNRFADIMKEEARSARLGRMEDLEDMRREEEEKQRKKKAIKK